MPVKLSEIDRIKWKEAEFKVGREEIWKKDVLCRQIDQTLTNAGIEQSKD